MPRQRFRQLGMFRSYPTIERDWPVDGKRAFFVVSATLCLETAVWEYAAERAGRELPQGRAFSQGRLFMVRLGAVVALP